MRYEEKWWNDHFDEYVEVLSGYVSCRSIAIPSDDSDAPFGLECHRMLEYMKNTMSSYGLDSKIYDHVFVDGVLHGSGGEKSKSIAIICHGDVVAAEGQWDEDPFKLYFKDDHLVGRGTTDNKGAAIAVLFAIRCLLENGWKPYNDFILRIGSAEEIGMRDVPLAKNLPKADLCLVPDSGFPVAYGEKGSIKAVFSFPWKSSLSISGGNGTSVIDMARAEFPDDVGFRKTDCPDDIEYLGSCVLFDSFGMK